MIAKSKPKASSALRIAGDLVKLYDIAGQLESNKPLSEALRSAKLTDGAYERMKLRHGPMVLRGDHSQSELRARMQHRAIRLLSDSDWAAPYQLERLADPATTSVDECWGFARDLAFGHISCDEMRQLSNSVLETNRQKMILDWLERAVSPLSLFGGQRATFPLYERVVWLSTVRLPCSVRAGDGEVAQCFKLFDRLLDLIERSGRFRSVPAFSAPVRGESAHTRAIAYAPWFWAVAAFLGPRPPRALLCTSEQRAPTTMNIKK